MNPMEDDTSSTALRPAVPTTEGSLAEAARGPRVSSNLPPPAPRQPLPSELDVEDAPTQPQQSSTAAGLPMPDCLQALASQGAADRRALMQDFETRFASRLLSLETMLAQRTSTADDVVADLAARVSVIERSLAVSNACLPRLNKMSPCYSVSVFSGTTSTTYL
ncbi:hypothetical protein MTO96_046675 [Rhipicephalus appendiculatus]